MNAQIQALEKARSFAYGELGNQMKSLITTQTELRSETGESGQGAARAAGRAAAGANCN